MNTHSATSTVRLGIDGERWITTSCHHSLDAFLCAGLVVERSITNQLQEFSQQRRNTGKDWRRIIEEFAETENFGQGVWANTYNGPNLLLPGARFFQTDTLAILQPHSGTDARVGYGEPKCFHDETGWLYRNGEAVLAPEGDRSIFWLTTDAGDTWQAGGAYPDLTEFSGSSDPADRGNGKVFVSHHQGFCPLSGKRLSLHLPFNLTTHADL